jgi:hypothetical protein
MATLSYTKPTVGASTDTWGDTLNANWDSVAAVLGTVDSTDIQKLEAITATAAELNVLDGVTATTAEINVLDGITASVTELNYTSGVTSSIQTQLDGKQDIDATLTAYAGTLTAANKIPYATSADVAGELDFKDEDDMASNSDTAVPSQQSVKAYVQAYVDTSSTGNSFTGPTSRSLSTSYQNTTGKPVFVNVVWVGNTSTSLSGYSLQISANNSTWITVGAHNTAISQNDFTFSTFVPDDYYWRVIKTSGANSVTTFTSVEFS